MVGDNFSKLLLDVLRVNRLTTNSRQDTSSFVELTLDDKVSWRLWEEEETSGKDDSRNQLNSNRDSVRSRVHAVLGSVVDGGCNHQAKGNGKLITSHDSTSDFARSDLGHIENDDGGDETDT